MSNYQYRNFSESELNWVNANQPSLRAREEGELLRGTLEFFAKYEDRNKEFLELRDEYNVDIRIGWDNVPHVWETGGRLQARAVELKKTLMDMHVYYPGTGEICMGTVPMIKAIYDADSTIKGIFHNLIIRYFYYHTYWKQKGVEPWKGLKHGNVGFIEDYADNRDIVCVSKYINCISPGLRKCIHIRKNSRLREMLFCDDCIIKECSCGIMEKYSIFQKDWIAYKSKHKK